MNDCTYYHDLMESLLADEISPGELAELNNHCISCADCQSLLDLHESLLSAGELGYEPTASELGAVRSEVLAATMNQQNSRFGKGFWSDLHAFNTAYPAAAAIVVFAMMTGAVFFGRWSVNDSTVAQDTLLQIVAQQSAQTISPQELTQASLEGFWDKPYSFANVSVRDQGTGQLGLSFDISRHVDVVTTRDSRLAQEVLLNAILDPSSDGSRFRAMAVTSNLPNARLRQAMIVTMHNDPSLTVRLQALSALAAGTYDEQVEEALMFTLQQDQEVQMRLEALDLLSKQQVGHERIRQTVFEAGLDSDNALLQRVSQMTNDF